MGVRGGRDKSDNNPRMIARRSLALCFAGVTLRHPRARGYELENNAHNSRTSTLGWMFTTRFVVCSPYTVAAQRATSSLHCPRANHMRHDPMKSRLSRTPLFSGSTCPIVRLRGMQHQDALVRLVASF